MVLLCTHALGTTMAYKLNKALLLLHCTMTSALCDLKLEVTKGMNSKQCTHATVCCIAPCRLYKHSYQNAKDRTV